MFTPILLSLVVASGGEKLVIYSQAISRSPGKLWLNHYALDDKMEKVRESKLYCYKYPSGSVTELSWLESALGRGAYCSLDLDDRGRYLTGTFLPSTGLPKIVVADLWKRDVHTVHSGPGYFVSRWLAKGDKLLVEEYFVGLYATPSVHPVKRSIAFQPSWKPQPATDKAIKLADIANGISFYSSADHPGWYVRRATYLSPDGKRVLSNWVNYFGTRGAPPNAYVEILPKGEDTPKVRQFIAIWDATDTPNSIGTGWLDAKHVLLASRYQDSKSVLFQLWKVPVKGSKSLLFSPSPPITGDDIQSITMGG